MSFTEKDITQCKNVIVALGKASFEKLSAQEVLALAQAFDWIGGLPKRIDDFVKNPPPPPFPVSAPSTEMPSYQGELANISHDDMSMGSNGLSEEPKKEEPKAEEQPAKPKRKKKFEKA